MTPNKLQPLNLPRPVQVCLDGTGLPLSVTGSHTVVPPHRSAHDRNGGKEASEHRPRPVVSIIEVWRVDDEWWRQPISRRYLEVVLEGGRHVVLYEDLNTGDWFMQRI